MSWSPVPEMRGRRVLVTGASSGTGPAVARAFAAAGAALALTYRQNRAAAESVAADCRAAGAAAVQVFPLDLMDAARGDALVAEVEKSLGGLDVFIGVAGAGGAFTPLLDAATSELTAALQGQIVGNFALARDAGLRMPRDGSGRVILVSATSSHKFSHGTYGLAKAALNTMVPFLAYELASRRVTVNALVPQLIDLDTIDPADRERRRRFTPLGVIPHPDQIAQFCLALCSPLYGIVTGELIHLDGGYRLRPPEDR